MKTKKKATEKGRCGACFRDMTVRGGLVVRHGWKESGASARRVGSYGLVTHSGSCFGAGWAPYELSAGCTVAFVEQILFPMAVRAQAHVNHLDTRPDLVFEGRVWAASWSDCRTHMRPFEKGGWDGYFRWSTKLHDGDGETLVKSHREDLRGTFVPSYESHLLSKRTDAESNRDAVERDALYCLEAVQEWKMETLVD